MGKTFINKLGNFLRIFKGRRNLENSNADTVTSSTSESHIRTSENSSEHQVKNSSNSSSLDKLKKSESLGTLAVVTVSTNKFNELKRANGAYDILENNKNNNIEVIGCFESSHRFCRWNHDSACVFSYNAKLHDDTIWSQALDRVLDKPITARNKCATPHLINAESSYIPQNAVHIVEPFTIPIIEEEKKERISLNDTKNYRKEVKIKYSENFDSKQNLKLNYNQNFTVQNEKEYSIISEDYSVANTGYYNLPRKISEPSETSYNIDHSVESSAITQVESNVFPDPSHIFIDEKNVDARMDSKSTRNEKSFCLSKFGEKPSGNHVEEARLLLENCAALNESKLILAQLSPHVNDGSNSTLIQNISSKTLNGNSTEYEVVNLAQVDLFREFKTTIAKMRNVLNVLEVKKSVHCISGRNIDKTKNDQSKTFITECSKNEQVSTQTTAMNFNRISTSSDIEYGHSTKNEGIMVKISSDTTSRCKTNPKNITLDSSLINYVKPPKPVRKRKRYKRVNKYKNDKVPKRRTNSISSALDDQLNIPTESQRMAYQKCVVYHITQSKNAIDKCVGTPLNASKNKDLILHNTFSALHFGPIHEFPVLLNKHENEKNKSKEIKSKSRTKDPKNATHYKRKSAILVTSEGLDSVNGIICHKSQTHPNLDILKSKDSSFISHTDTTANWFVFEPGPPLIIPDKQSTSDDKVSSTNSISTQELVSKLLEEEFKTSGLRGRISNGTINLIREHFYNKLNGMQKKDIPDIMITVCVPLKEIVSNMNASSRACREKSKAMDALGPNCITMTKISLCEKGVQVKISRKDTRDNHQIIKEKNSRKATQMNEHKNLNKTTSCSESFIFKKVFGNKTTSCSDINPLDRPPHKPSKIFYSDHSTSIKKFLPIQNNFDGCNVSSKPITPTDEKTTDKSISESFLISSDLPESRQRCCVNLTRQRNGFFLNLPLNGYKRKRAQISKLFDESDSSELRYSGDPKLLYHVHDSSFYSSSITDNKVNVLKSQPQQNVALDDTSKAAYFPVQQIASRMDIKVKPKFISFSDLAIKHNTSSTSNFLARPVKNGQYKTEMTEKKFQSVMVNTLSKTTCLDNSTQYVDNNVKSPLGENIVGEKEKKKRTHKKGVQTETYPINCIDEFSMMSFPKVRFEDEVFKGEINSKDIFNSNKSHEKAAANVEKKDILLESASNNPCSALSFFAEVDSNTENSSQLVKNEIVKTPLLDQKETINDFQEHNPQELTQRDNSTSVLQEFSDCHLPQKKQTNKEKQIVYISNKVILPKNRFKRRKAHTETKNDSTQSIECCYKNEAEISITSPEPETSIKSQNNLNDLIKDIVSQCNTSFIRSRDCIVELTLYNLIKEIIIEHCSHLSEQSKVKVESILANFVESSKCKVENENVEIVESAIENLVKEIQSSNPLNSDNKNKSYIRNNFRKKQTCDNKEDTENHGDDRSFHDEHNQNFKKRNKHYHHKKDYQVEYTGEVNRPTDEHTQRKRKHYHDCEQREESEFHENRNKYENERNQQNSHREKHYNQYQREDHEHHHKHKFPLKKKHHRHAHHRRKTDDEHSKNYHHRIDRSKSDMKAYEEHNCNTNGKCDLQDENDRCKFRSIESKEDYMELVRKLKELEEVTKQLSAIAYTRQEPVQKVDRLSENICSSSKYNHVCTFINHESDRFLLKKKMKLSMSNVEQPTCKRFRKNVFDIHYMQQKNLVQPLVSIPRNEPKLPITEIVINLSKRNCLSLMTASVAEPNYIGGCNKNELEPMDEILMNEIISYELKKEIRNKAKEFSCRFIKRSRRRTMNIEDINKKRKSFTISLQGRKINSKTRFEDNEMIPKKKKKDYMRFKIVGKKNLLTSGKYQPILDNGSFKKQVTEELNHENYGLKNDLSCLNAVKHFAKKKSEQTLHNGENLDLAYQRMANFCMFRGLLRRQNSNQN